MKNFQALASFSPHTNLSLYYNFHSVFSSLFLSKARLCHPSTTCESGSGRSQCQSRAERVAFMLYRCPSPERPICNEAARNLTTKTNLMCNSLFFLRIASLITADNTSISSCSSFRFAPRSPILASHLRLLFLVLQHPPQHLFLRPQPLDLHLLMVQLRVHVNYARVKLIPATKIERVQKKESFSSGQQTNKICRGAL